jgi:Protein of unknown function (DUF3828)
LLKRGAWLLIGILVALVASTRMEGAPDAASAKRFLESVYVRYNKGGTPMDIEGPNANSVFDPSLIALEHADARAASPDVGVLDWDPICGCQDDVDIRNLKIDVSSAGSTRAKAAVSFDVQDGTHTALMFTLAIVSGHWRIYNICIVDPSNKAPSFNLREELLKAAGPYSREKTTKR